MADPAPVADTAERADFAAQPFATPASPRTEGLYLESPSAGKGQIGEESVAVAAPDDTEVAPSESLQVKKQKSKKAKKKAMPLDDATPNAASADDSATSTTTPRDNVNPESNISYSSPTELAVEKEKKHRKKKKKSSAPAADVALSDESTNTEIATATSNAGGETPRARGFTAVNQPPQQVVMQVANPRPSPPLELTNAAAQLLIECAAAVNAVTEKQKGAEGDVVMNSSAANVEESTPGIETAKKSKRKRHAKTTQAAEGDEQDSSAPPPASVKKRKGKERAETRDETANVDATPEVQVEGTQQEPEAASVSASASIIPSSSMLPPATEAESPPPARAYPAEGSAATAKKRKKSKHSKDKVGEQQEQQVQQHDSLAQESIIASQPIADGDAAASAYTTMTAVLESPAVTTKTPKPKSKLAIAYERKRKRLEAAAAAAAQASNTTGDASLEMEVHDEDDDEDPNPTAAAPVASTPKSNKRKKRRLPDLTTPLRTANTMHDTPHTDSDGEGVAGAEDATSTSKPGSSKRRKSSAIVASATRRSTLNATPQPGTTAVARKRASYTYAPNPTPKKPPSTGTFTQPECELIDQYLANFSTQNNLDQKKLVARIWGDTVVPDQSKAGREGLERALRAIPPS